jgi:hypothetical protein
MTAAVFTRQAATFPKAPADRKSGASIEGLYARVMEDSRAHVDEPAPPRIGPVPAAERVSVARALRGARAAALRPADLRQLQRTAGNRAVVALLRVVQGDVLHQSVSPAFAHALTDTELAAQLGIVRAAAQNSSDAVVQEAARANELVLEQEAADRDPHGSSASMPTPAPAAAPAPAAPGERSPAPLVGPPLSLAIGSLIAVTPTPPMTQPPGMVPPPGLPTPGGPSPGGPPPGGWQYRPPPRIVTPPVVEPPVTPPVEPPPIWIPGAFACAAVVGLIVFLWPNQTAPPWMDEINPITGGPYRDRAEYDQVSRMTPEALTAAIQSRRGSSGQTRQAPGAPVPAPATDPTPAPPARAPGTGGSQPAQAPGTSSGPAIAPGTSIEPMLAGRIADLPAFDSDRVDWLHIYDGHWDGTPLAPGTFRRTVGNNTMFSGLTREQIQRVVRDAYRSADQKLQTQDDRIRVRGRSGSWTVEFWVNKATRRVESAYPIF